MKTTGVIRQLDSLGRIVLPIELRRTLDIGPKDMLEIFVEGNSVILRKYEPDELLIRAIPVLIWAKISGIDPVSSE